MSLSKDRRSYKTDVASNGGRTSTKSKKLVGVVRGLLVTIAEDGTPMVDFDGNPRKEPVPAISTIAIAQSDTAREIVLMFEDADAHRPIILGLVQSPASLPGQALPSEVSLDGERVTLTAEKEIVLRCGQASITLTRAGKVLIRGAYLLSRSSGVNRIKGGSVQIN